MALIKCPECGKDVSDTCVNCMHCGYSLQTVAIGSESSISMENQQKNSDFKKYKSPIIVAVAIILVGLVIGVLIHHKINTTPFDKLYGGKSRESVHSIWGEPDRTFRSPTTGWESDTYHEVEFLGKKGVLSVWYDNDFVTHSYFDYYYFYKDNDVPTSEELDDAREYALSVIEHYTEKYGKPKEGYYEFEWSLPDGSTVALDYDFDADFQEDVTIYWSN